MKINWTEYYKNIDKVLTEKEKAKLLADLEEENSIIEDFENLEMAL